MSNNTFTHTHTHTPLVVPAGGVRMQAPPYRNVTYRPALHWIYYTQTHTHTHNVQIPLQRQHQPPAGARAEGLGGRSVHQLCGLQYQPVGHRHGRRH
jgi:hypothetical protein